MAAEKQWMIYKQHFSKTRSALEKTKNKLLLQQHNIEKDHRITKKKL
jgi:hypothetical protein